MQEPPKTLGGEITRLRTEAGLTLKDLAESVGCRSPYIEAIGLGLVVVKARDRRARELSFTLFLLLLCGNVLGCWSALLAPIRE